MTTATLIAALRESLAEADPIAMASAVEAVALAEPDEGQFAEALAALVLESSATGIRAARDELLLDHLVTLGPPGQTQLQRIALISSRWSVVEGAMARREWPLNALPLDTDAEPVVAAILREAMLQRTTWTPNRWTRFVEQSELSREASTRIVWGLDRTKVLFRRTPEGEAVDATDHPVDVGEAEAVGVPHTLDFDEPSRDLWGRVFAEYDIVSIVSQFDRPIAFAPASRSQRDAVPIHRSSPLDATLRHFVQRGWRHRKKGSRRFFDRDFGNVVSTVSWHEGDDRAHLLELYFADRGGTPRFLGDVPRLAYSEARLTLSELDVGS